MRELDNRTIKMFSRLGSCGVYGMAMADLAEDDDSLAVLTADLCYYSGLDGFSKKYPELLYNVGIAEQNLIGVAAGLAKEGCVPFASTYASFAVTRALDQVRVNMGYMQLPIKLVGLTSGFSVGILGATHICIEDLAIMRSIPNIVILSPADGVETYKALIAASKYEGPVYIRMTGTMGLPIVYDSNIDYTIGKAITIKDDGEIAIIATGTMVSQSKEAVKILNDKGINCKLIDMHTIKPLDCDCIYELLKTSKLIVTVEEHSIYGGLGGAVAELLAGELYRPPHLIIGVDDEYSHAASYEYLVDKYHLTPQKIAEKIINKIKEI